MTCSLTYLKTKVIAEKGLKKEKLEAIWARIHDDYRAMAMQRGGQIQEPNSNRAWWLIG